MRDLGVEFSSRLISVRHDFDQYNVVIAEGIIADLSARFPVLSEHRRWTVISDRTVWQLHARAAVEAWRRGGRDIGEIVLEPGETSKSLAVAEQIYNRLADRRHERGEPIVAVGGGVVTDLAGFVAATWQRGVPWVACPTTLEGAIDAAIGGKTAVNHASGKNLIGAFHQPSGVCVDIATLATLPRRDYVAALAESVKHAVALRPAMLNWHSARLEAIAARDPATLLELIALNVEIKAAVVMADEREMVTRGVGRAVLNLGHTVGHALEVERSLDLRHGEAVALGLVAELSLATELTAFPAEDCARVVALLAALGLPTRLPTALDVESVIDRMRRDKKVRESTIRLVLPRALGTVEWAEIHDTASLDRALATIAPV